MKIFLSTDMEGTAGVVDWAQCLPGEAEYDVYRRLLLDEVNAAIDGAADAGAEEFLVNDSHSSMRNLFPDQLHGRASYLSGRHKPLYMMQGLDESFDAAFFVSYHGSMGASEATLSHTYNSNAIAEVRLNGVVAGESAINALVAVAHKVPVVLITGDSTTAREAEPFFPGIEAVVVKESHTRFAATSLHPEVACERIRAGARRAVERLESFSVPAVTLPATLRVRLRNADQAEVATWLGGVRRVDGTAVEISDDDPLRLFKSFITTVLLTRSLPE